MIKDFKHWHRHNRAFDDLLQLLPGKNKIRVGLSSRHPFEIIECLTQLSSYDTILLTQTDVWRYGADKTLIEFFESKPQKFYISTLGYQNKKICNNAYELAHDTFWFSKSNTELNLKPANSTLGFGCLNRMPRFHRTMLGLKLWQSNLLNKLVYSLNDVSEGTSYLQTQLLNEPGWEEFANQVPFKYLDSDGVFNDHSTLHPAYSTYCNIITESETEYFGYNEKYPTPVITEKSWKPFLSCQIPVYLTAQGHLKYLNKFGLELFEHILPSGYDDMDTFAKIKAIVDLVANCDIKDVYFENIDGIQHNHELVTSDKIGQQIVAEILDFVYNN